MFDKPYLLKGKHATYARFLSATTERLDKEAKAAGIFNTTVEMYVVASLIGAVYNNKVAVDTASTDSYSIFGDAIIGKQSDLDFVYRLILLADDSENLTDDEKIQSAFKDDENEEKTAKNLDLFHQYMRGGIEWLYENITEDATTKEDYLQNINGIVKLYKEDFNESYDN